MSIMRPSANPMLATHFERAHHFPIISDRMVPNCNSPLQVSWMRSSCSLGLWYTFSCSLTLFSSSAMNMSYDTNSAVPNSLISIYAARYSCWWICSSLSSVMLRWNWASSDVLIGSRTSGSAFKRQYSSFHSPMLTSGAVLSVTGIPVRSCGVCNR